MLPSPLVVLTSQVYVILFGADGPQESEGIYSVRALGQDGLPTDTVVAFESRADAERYCGEP